MNQKNKQLTIASLSQILGAEYDEKKLKNREVERVLTQSIYVNPGDAVIVVCWYNTKLTIDEALKRNASVVFCEKEAAIKYSDHRIIGVADPLECVEKFEKYCEQGCNAKRITITGSVGKTTTTGLINSIISNTYKTLTHHSMSNSHGAILRNFQKLNPEHEFWVQEVGGVQPRYIESSAYMLHSDAVVLTNIGVSHLDNYGSKQGVFKDKSSLERYAKYNSVVVINYDDEILRNSEYSHKIISFAINNTDADYYAENIIMDKTGTMFDLVCNEGRYKITLNLLGKYNVYNALAAIAVGRWANVSMNRIIELLKQYKTSGLRQNMVNIGGYTLLLDCYNAEPQTVLGSAITLSQLCTDNNGKKIFVTGHIDKLGTDSIKMHRELGYKLADLDIDEMVFFAGDSKYTYDAVIKAGYMNAHFMNSREELDNWIKENIKKEDITFYKSGQFEAALTKSIDHVYGTRFQNEQQYNEGTVKTEGDFNFRIRQDDIIEICQYHGENVKISVPYMYQSFPVLRIGWGAFKRNSKLEEIDLPDTIDNIGPEAFFVCTNLKKIKMPDCLKYIHRSAFNYCTKLKCIELPEGLLHIEARAFRECLSLEKIIIPESVGFIGYEAFKKCPKLTIFCKENSYAQRYAIQNKIDYEVKENF